MIPKVLIDARKLGDGGIGVYIENLVDGLLLLNEKGSAKSEISLLVSGNLFYSSSGELKKNSVPASYRSSGLGSIIDTIRLRWEGKVNFILETAAKYSLSEYFFLPHRQKKELLAHDIYHSPHYTLPFNLNIPKVVTIHDLIHLSHPENFYHRPVASFLIRSAVKRADQIITVSKESCRQLKEFIGDLTVPISIVPNALRANMFKRTSNEVADFKKREFLTRPYCLYVGSDRPHKGFSDLISSWVELQKSTLLEQCPDLIVVGKSFNKVRDRVQELGLDAVVRFFGEVSTERLEILYSGASAVLVPSRVEGFGLPALEALGMGVPVICANIPSLKEICEDAAYFVENTNALGTGCYIASEPSISNSGTKESVSFVEAVANVLNNPEEAKVKTRLGLKIAAKYSIEECALKTWKIYQNVILKKQGKTPEVIENTEMPISKLVRPAPLESGKTS